MKKQGFCGLVLALALLVALGQVVAAMTPLRVRGDVHRAATAGDDLVFIHHSCGSNWLNNSLHDALLAKSYIDERNATSPMAPPCRRTSAGQLRWVARRATTRT